MNVNENVNVGMLEYKYVLEALFSWNTVTPCVCILALNVIIECKTEIRIVIECESVERSGKY